MAPVSAFCVLLVVLTTTVHYEVLRGLSLSLPVVRVPSRARLIIVILATFAAHAVEVLLYGIAYFVLMHFPDLGALRKAVHLSLSNCLYFSAETYTSLGFGDIVPSGPLRLLVGAEALNGLLLIGWSASYIYISMERFWNTKGGDG
ncbi:MAG: potassium channel family protein [Chromatiales bacterium]